ncbi:MAG: HAMP domain-containing histidine kinase [Planctomycetales bacterium]|nr:HAMP domain-containing histidine kinase [Planctomycetales bacterium]
MALEYGNAAAQSRLGGGVFCCLHDSARGVDEMSMHVLPAIHVGRMRPRLPLSARSAERLLGIVLIPSLRRRRRRLRQLLARDPALLVWALGNLAPARRARCRRLSSVAQVMAEPLIAWLMPLAQSARTDEPVIDEARCAEVAGAASAVAVLAAKLAPGENAATHEAYFLGLLHSVRNWLELSPGKSPSERELLRWLPEICTDEADPSPSSAAATRAIALLSGEARATDEEQPLLDFARRRRAQEKKDWRVCSPGAAGKLAALVRRLARLEDLETAFQRTLHREKLESLRQLAYGASHEINNPLANISARAQSLLKEETSPENRRRLAAIKTQAHRAHEMIADMMLFSRPPALHVERLDLAELLAELVAELAEQSAAQGTRVVSRGLERPLTIEADPVQLQVALQALLRNSLEAIGQGGEISITVRRVARQGTPSIAIDVQDNGPGISDDAMRHLFDPFYSGREAGRGLGFGLSKCWRIVTEHGGAMSASNPATGGAHFRVLLPRRAADLSAAETPPSSPAQTE